MTDKPTPTPTDAELEALLLDKLPASKHYIRPVIEKMVAAMQAAIDKWDQPAVKGDPVAWLSPWRKDQVTTDYDAYGKQGIPLYAAPQPVARVPLDEARRLFDAGWKAAALFCDREDVVADGIIGFGACPQVEAALSAAQPVAREPLTPERLREIERMCVYANTATLIDFARAIERAHGSKGGQHG